VYILSDHGQSACKPFSLAAGQSIVELLQSALANMAVKHETHLDEKTSQLLLSWQGTTRLAQNLPWYLRGPVNKYSKYLERKFREAAQKSREWEDLFDLTVVSTGPIAYAYWTNSADKVTVETIEQEHPGLLDRLASHSSVGIVTAVRDDGLVLAKSGSHHALISETGIISQSGTMPYDRARNRDHAVRGLWRITRFARSGDICIWGGYAPSGDISYSYEMGCHSGWTDEETEAFVIAPKGTDFDFSQIVRHKEFYEFFSKRYGPWCVQGKNLTPMDPRAVTEAAHVTLSAANSD